MNIPKPLPIAVPIGIAQPQSVVGADAMLQQVNAGIKGVKDRIAGLDLVTVPAAFIGPTPAYTFKPQTSSSFYLDVYQDGSPPPPDPASTWLPVNYVMQSGTTYQLPVIIGGNGVFLAHRFRITLWQRFYNPNNAIVEQRTVSPMVNGFFDYSLYGRPNWTTKFSLFPLQPSIFGPAYTFPAPPNQSPGINYRWNIQDPVTGYNYADNLMPASAVLNRDRMVQHFDTTGASITPSYPFDGDWHEFDAPWRFDTAYQLNVLFRPITDIVQFDSSVNLGPGGLNLIDYDDRVSGVRDESVSIQVEFQGERIGGKS